MSSVSALRPDSRGPFGEEERALLRLLMPHLHRALHIHRRLVGAGVMQRALGDALDRLPTGVILVRRDATILMANKSAEQILAMRDGLTSTKPGLMASVSNENRQLHSLVAAAAQTSGGHSDASGGTLKISRPSFRRPLSVLVTPIHSPLAGDFGDVTHIAALFVTDPDRRIADDAPALRAIWGLTPAEAAIATAVANGSKLREIAECRSTQVSTVR
jgi:PAS domain-containing protein